MKPPRLFMAFGIVAGLSGCGTWVDTEGTGCNDEQVKQANENTMISGAMGTLFCQVKGEGEFDGEFRCKGSVLQVKCKG